MIKETPYLYRKRPIQKPDVKVKNSDTSKSMVVIRKESNVPLEASYKVIKSKKKDKELVTSELSQKLRSDRLAKKELRVAEMKARLKRLKTAEKAQAKLQSKLSKILNKKKKEDINTNLYRNPANVQQTRGSILTVPNLFTSQDGRERSNKYDSNILRTPNLLFGTSKANKTPKKPINILGSIR